jgi:hypothetical protein
MRRDSGGGHHHHQRIHQLTEDNQRLREQLAVALGEARAAKRPGQPRAALTGPCS